jgi:shikimate dehydrogenase
MRQFGLIGKSLSHSFSKNYFEEKFVREKIADASYSLFELSDIKEITGFIQQNPHLLGFNVTIPYKQIIIPFLDELSEEAAAVGAVNTVCVQRVNNQFFTKGYNTDIIGFEQSLQHLSVPDRALVLGTGGAAAAVTYVLERVGCHCTVVSHDPSMGIPYHALTSKDVADHRLIVNCTPVGTYPNVDKKPDIPYDGITENHILYDLVYNPAITAFLNEGRHRGAQIVNGLAMLHAQAEAAWTVWNA